MQVEAGVENKYHYEFLRPISPFYPYRSGFMVKFLKKKYKDFPITISFYEDEYLYVHEFYYIYFPSFILGFDALKHLTRESITPIIHP